MRTNLALDDQLVAEAQRLTGTTEKSARRLARLCGTEPALTGISRRRSEAP